MRSVATIALLTVSGLLGLGPACSGGSFECVSDEQCGEEGVCQASGACSFPDQQCASGQRYGGLSPSGLADACVPVSESGATDGGPESGLPAETGAEDLDGDGGSGGVSGSTSTGAGELDGSDSSSGADSGTTWEGGSTTGAAETIDYCPSSNRAFFTGCGEPPELTYSQTIGCGVTNDSRQWDFYVIEDVVDGQCVAARADNGAGAADLRIMILDLEGSYYGFEPFEFDDDVSCSVTPWNNYACPSDSIIVKSDGPIVVAVNQFRGLECVDGAEYSLGVTVDGVPVDLSDGPAYDELTHDQLCQ